ncbi:hypothetical protein J6590_075298 [Homalodisca vitripennis]|nr:hypothetical protein J6590_075298 [Homalodisca vitripennis]
MSVENTLTWMCCRTTPIARMRLFTVTVVDVVTWIVCDALLLWIVSTVIALNICNGCEPARCNVTVDTVPMMPDVRQSLVLVRHKTLKMLHENLTDFSYSLERHTKNGQFRFIKFNITTSMSGIDEALKNFQEESLRIVRTEPPTRPSSLKTQTHVPALTTVGYFTCFTCRCWPYPLRLRSS